MWISVACAFLLDAEGRLSAVRQTWTFNEMFSSYALFGLDADGDGRFSTTELSALEDEVVSAYRAERFFTKASIDGADVTLRDADDVQLQVNGQGVLLVSFTQRLAGPTVLTGADFRLQVVDPSVFVDFRSPVEGFATIEPPTAACSAARDDGQPPKNADPEALMRALIDGGAKIPTRAVTLRCR